MQINTFTGMSYVLRGARLITKPKIRIFAFAPMLINSLLFTAGIVLSGHYISTGFDQWLPEWLNWIRYLLWPLFAVFALALVFFTFTIFANLIAAPFNGPLAEAVEIYLTGSREETEFSWAKLSREIAQAMLSELKKYSYFALWAIPILIMFVIPGVNLIASVLWFFFGAGVLAVEYADYPMGNHGHLFPQQRKILMTKWRVVLEFGCTVMVMTMVPILNFIAMPVAVAGATILWVEQFKTEHGDGDSMKKIVDNDDGPDDNGPDDNDTGENATPTPHGS